MNDKYFISILKLRTTNLSQVDLPMRSLNAGWDLTDSISNADALLTISFRIVQRAKFPCVLVREVNARVSGGDLRELKLFIYGLVLGSECECTSRGGGKRVDKGLGRVARSF